MTQISPIAELEATRLAGLFKYSDDQPRDDHGRFAAGGSVSTEQLHGHVQGFLGVHPEDRQILNDKNWSKGSCETVARELSSYLREQGVDAKVIEATGFKPDLPTDAHPDWLKFKGKDQKFLWHATVQTGDKVIDLTGSQYGSKYGGARIIPLHQFKQEWHSVKDATRKMTAGKIGNLLKAAPSLPPADPDDQSEAAKRARRNIKREVGDTLDGMRDRVPNEAADAYDANDNADEAMDSINLDDFDDLATGAIPAALHDVYVNAGQKALDSLGVDDTAIVDLFNKRAADYARERGAELVGKRWVNDALVDNPDARWAISQTTRDGLRDMIVKSYEDGKTPVQLAKQIEDSYLFSESRAQMIASTECLVGDTQVSTAMVRAAFRRFYDGPVVEVLTSNGRKFTTTPNHPMLTKRGWLATGEITESDYLVCDSSQQNSVPRNPDSKYPPTTISEIFETLSVTGGTRREFGGTLDFHGDGREDYVNTAFSNGVLPFGEFTPIYKSTVDNFFAPSDLSRAACCPFCKLLLPVNKSFCFCAGAHFYACLVQATLYNMGVYAILTAKSRRRRPGQVLLDNFLGREIGMRIAGAEATTEESLCCLRACPTDSPSFNLFMNKIIANSNLLGDHCSTEAGLVEFDHVVSVNIHSFCGHVYNLETPYGYFTINGVYTGNTAKASVQGTLGAWQESGVVKGKAWQMSNDHDQDDECNDNEDAGVIGLDEDFPSGDDGPPAHPNCMCAVYASLEGPDDEEEDTEKLAKYSEDQPRDERGRFGSGSGSEKVSVPSREEQDKAIGEIKQQLQMVSDVQGGRGTDAFVLANGRPFYMNDKTFDGARGTPKLCYMNASQAIMSDSSLTYVEGSVHIGPLSIGHAWVVDKQGNVIDPTLKLTSGAINPRGYFGVPFKSEYVMKTMAKTNVYGVISHTNRDIFGAKPETFRASLKLVKYSSDQPRDEMGRFGSTGLKEQDDRIRAVLERSDANPRRIAAEATIAARGDCRNDPGVLDVNGRYTPDAHTENQRIASEFLNPNAKSDMPEATFMLGKPGAGKSTILGDRDLSKVTMINSDLVKESLPGYSPTIAYCYHDRSCDIARNYLTPQAIADRHNVIFDMTDNKDKLLATAQALKDAGYKISIIHADVDTATSVERAYSRFERGGRYVPVRTVLSYEERPTAAYNAAKGIADSWKSYDSTGRTPKLIESGSR